MNKPFILKITEVGNIKMNSIAHQKLHLNLLSPNGHYAIFNPDFFDNAIYISILTHQPKFISLLNSKAYNVNTLNEKVQQVRTNFMIKIDNPEKMTEVVVLLQKEQIITLQDLKKVGQLEAVTQEINNVMPLISYENAVNLTDTGRNIEEIKKNYNFGNPFEQVQRGYLTTRIPIEEHFKVRDHLLNNVKNYQQYGMSNIDNEFNFADYMSKTLRHLISTHSVFTSISGPMSPALAEKTKADTTKLIANLECFRTFKTSGKRFDDLD